LAPQHLGDSLGVDVAREPERGACVPEIVEASADGANSIPDTRNARLIFVLWVGNGHNGTCDEDKIGEREDYMKK
jgi:hypothetical protein